MALNSRRKINAVSVSFDMALPRPVRIKSRKVLPKQPLYIEGIKYIAKVSRERRLASFETLVPTFGENNKNIQPRGPLSPHIAPPSSGGDPSQGFKIYKDQKLDTLRARTDEEIPVIPIPAFRTPFAGGVLYEPTTQRIYYATGTQWIPINPGGGSGNAVSYSLIKTGEQIILPLTMTIITGWAIAPSPPYHDNTGEWNLVTGVYTAVVASTVSFDVDLSWKAGISNIGNRTLRIIYKPFAGLPLVAKEAITQADPNTNVETTQEAGTFLEMGAGDEAWVEVFHNSNVNLVVTTGNSTTVSGVKLTV